MLLLHTVCADCFSQITAFLQLLVSPWNYEEKLFSIQSSRASLKQMLVMACATSKDWPSLSLFSFFSKSAKEIDIITTDKSVLSSKRNGPCLFFLSFFLWSGGLCRKATKENTHVEPHTQGTQSRNAPPWLQLHSHVTFNFLLSPLTNTAFVSGDYLHT